MAWLPLGALLLGACGTDTLSAEDDAGGRGDAIAGDAAALDGATFDGGVQADAAPPPPVGLAAKYPHDIGLASDPAVVWTESYEEGSIPALAARYDAVKQAGLALSPDVPALTAGKASGRFRASPAQPASDLYKRLPKGYDELWVRYYAKYQSGIHWHHSSVWFGGYQPLTSYPNPQAGLKPVGDDRIAIAIEPAPGE